VINFERKRESVGPKFMHTLLKIIFSTVVDRAGGGAARMEIIVGVRAAEIIDGRWFDKCWK